MIPILYESTETQFLDGGICYLGDCVYNHVTESRNGIYECEFQYPITGNHYEEITEGRYIACTHDDKGDIQPFKIYRHSAPIDGIVTFYAHHLSYALSEIVLEPMTGTSPAGVFNELTTKSINSNPFTFWTSKSGTGDFKVESPTSIRSVLYGNEGSIVDVFGGGEYEFTNWTVKLHGQRGVDTDVTIRYGKNMSDVTYTRDNEDMYNAVVPYWKGRVESEQDPSGSMEDEIVMLENKIVMANGVLLSTAKAKAVDFSSLFETRPTQQQLRYAAESYLSSNQPWEPIESIKVNFIQLWQTQEYENVASLQMVSLCDTVSVYYPELGVTAEGVKVVRVVYDVLMDRYVEMELGTTRSNFIESIEANYDKQIQQIATGFEAILKAEINHATQLLTNPGDSHVIFVGLDKNGNKVYGNGTVPNPQEILIMNTTNPSTATEILRINKNGIGFANNINGPYRSAWTLDGHFIADFITAGTINGNLIRTGVLSDYNTSTFVPTSDTSVQVGKAYYIKAPVKSYDGNGVYSVGDLVRYNGTVYKCTTAITSSEEWTPSHWATATNQDFTYVLVNSPMPVELGSYYELQNNHRNYWNLETGEFSLSASTSVGNSTIASQQDLDDLSDDIHNDMDAMEDNIKSEMVAMEERLTPEELTQQRVFNALTNNGQTMGIWLKASDNKLYINASYIATGVLADANNNTIFSLETGKLTMNKGSINISNRFIVSESGYLTCSGASIEGEFKAGSGYWIKLNSSGELCGGYGNNQYGYIDFSANVWDIPMQQYLKGIQIQGDILRINTYRIAAAQSTNVGTTTYSGGNGTLRVIYDVFYDSNGVVQGRIKDYTVINGLICSEFDW